MKYLITVFCFIGALTLHATHHTAPVLETEGTNSPLIGELGKAFQKVRFVAVNVDVDQEVTKSKHIGNIKELCKMLSSEKDSNFWPDQINNLWPDQINNLWPDQINLDKTAPSHAMIQLIVDLGIVENMIDQGEPCFEVAKFLERNNLASAKVKQYVRELE